MNKLILFFSGKYRYTQLNTCLKFYKNKNLYLITIKSKILFKIILFIFKKKTTPILNDGSNMSYNFSNYYNLWFNTKNEIPNSERKKTNNFFICEDLKKENIIFPLTPIINSSFTINLSLKTKIIYISEVNINVNREVQIFWEKNKKMILSDLSLINKISYIDKIFKNGNEKGYENYIQLKNLLRFEMIKNVNKYFKDRLIVVGKDWKELGFNATVMQYNTNFRKKIYRNNLCLDFGSKSGCNALYPRTVEILESGGFLLQATQTGSQKLKEKMCNYESFNSLEEFLIKLKKLLTANMNLKIENYKYLENEFNAFLEKI